MKHKRSISLLATAALFAGFLAVTPPAEVMPVAVADPPITHTFWVVYATHDAIDDSTREDFLSTANLNAIIDRAEAYWVNETGGAIDSFTIGGVETLQASPDIPLWSHDGRIDALAMGRFPGVDVFAPRNHLLTLVTNSEAVQPPGESPFGGTAGFTFPASLAGSGFIRLSIPDAPTGSTPAGYYNWAGAALAHEIGHNLGLFDAGRASCPAPVYDGTPQSTPACSFQRYSDTSDIMGDPSWSYGGTLAAYRRSELGLLAPGVGLFQPPGDSYTGTITLTALELQDFDTLNEIRITDPTDPTAVYSIEFRSDTLPFGTTIQQGVRVIRILRSGETSYLTVPVSAGGTNQYLRSGDSFTSASGQIRFTVTAMNSTNTTINLHIGEQPASLDVYVDYNLAPLPPVVGIAPYNDPLGPYDDTLYGYITSNSTWSVTSKPSWATVTPMSGTGDTEIEIGATLHSGAEPRFGEIVFTASGTPNSTQSVSVVQGVHDICGGPYDDPLESGISWCSWPDLSQPLTGVIDSHQDSDSYTFTAPSSGQWTIQVDVPYNPNLGSVLGYYANLAAFMNLYDETTGEYLGQGRSEMNQYGGAAEPISPALVAGHTYRIDVWSYATSSYGSFTLTATPTPRISLSQDEWIADPGGGSTSIDVTADMPWTISAPDWVYVSPKSGTGNATVYLDVSNLSHPESLIGIVTFSTTDTPSSEATVHVTQNNDDCGDATSGVPCIVEEMDSTVVIGPYTDPNWSETERQAATDIDRWVFTATSTGLWSVYALVLDPELTGTVTLSHEETALSSSILGGSPPWLVAYVEEGETYTIDWIMTPGAYPYSFIQSGVYEASEQNLGIDLYLEENRVSHFGAELTLRVGSAGPWTMTTPSWVTANPTNGLGSADVTLTVDSNAGGAVRTGSVTVTSTLAPTRTGEEILIQPGDTCGDTPETACGFSNQGTTDGTIDWGGDKDWYAINVPVTGQYTFTSSAPANNPLGDPYGTVYRSDGLAVAYNDDGAGNRQFSITTILPAGTYYLEVRGYNTSYTGNYSVSVTYPPLLASVSFYENVPASGSYYYPSIYSREAWTISGPDWITLSPSSGTGSRSLTLRVQANASTTPRTGVVTIQGETSPTVTITVSQEGITIDTCGASTLSYCIWSPLTTPTTGIIDTGGDTDWYKIVPTTTGTWTLKASKPSTSALGDSYGILYAANGTTRVAADDDSGGSSQFMITATLTAGQTYWLEVRGYSTNHLGSFIITATPPA